MMGRFLAACVLAVALMACGEEPAGRVTAVWFDLSQSTRAHREAYLEDFERIVAAAEPGERLVIGGISRSTTTANILADVEIPSFNALDDNRVAFDHEVEQMTSKLIKNVRQTTRARVGKGGTDVIGAFELSAQIFSAYRDLGTADLVVFTDGFQTESVSLIESGSSSVEMLHAVRRERTIPQLNGVTVHMVGVGTSRRDLAPKVTRTARDFWFSFVRATGAQMGAGDYGQRLLAWR